MFRFSFLSEAVGSAGTGFPIGWFPEELDLTKADFAPEGPNKAPSAVEMKSAVDTDSFSGAPIHALTTNTLATRPAVKAEIAMYLRLNFSARTLHQT